MDIEITIHFIKLESEKIPLYAKARVKMVFVQVTEHGIMDCQDALLYIIIRIIGQTVVVIRK